MNRSIQLKISGMHCAGCEQTIESAVALLPGVSMVKADYIKATVSIEFDGNLVQESGIRRVIEEKGYELAVSSHKPPGGLFMSGLVFAILLLVLGGITYWGKSLMPGLMKSMNAQIGYSMLFSIGFFTGFHCIGMCGGFVVAYTTAIKPRTARAVTLAHALYGLGKTASYVAIGAAFGLLGSVLTFTPYMRGVAALGASLFLVLYGLKMLNVFRWLRYFTLRMPASIARGVANETRNQRNPFVVGLLNGFMLGCGPLQAMYIMAAGTGNPLEGAAILLFFGLGTLIPLIGFGLFASTIPRNMMQQLSRVSAVLVIAMGLMMADRGLKLTQSGFDFSSMMSH